MSKRDINLLLKDIIEAAGKILAYTKGMDYNGFISDNKTIDAVVRNFEIIGEAAKRVPDDYKQKYPAIPWKYITAFRNRIIHEYFGVDYEIVWEIREQNIHELIEQIELRLGEA